MLLQVGSTYYWIYHCFFPTKFHKRKGRGEHFIDIPVYLSTMCMLCVQERYPESLGTSNPSMIPSIQIMHKNKIMKNRSKRTKFISNSQWRTDWNKRHCCRKWRVYINSHEHAIISSTCRKQLGKKLSSRKWPTINTIESRSQSRCRNGRHNLTKRH